MKAPNPYAGMSREDLRALRAEQVTAARLHKIEAQRARGEAERISQAIGDLHPSSPMVSDHAVIRWLQRVEGLDVDAVRRTIAAIVAASGTFGGDRLVEHDGFLICLTDDHVTTVLGPEQRPKGRKPKEQPRG